MKVWALFLASILWVQVGGQSCPELYRRYSAQHTYCLPPNSQCKIEVRNLKPGDKEIILREHNLLRSQVASGNEKTYSMPTASNMLQMVWDDELAAIAQKHADQCVFDHDCSDCRRVKNFGVGQNLAERSKLSSPPSKADWAGRIKSWYSEVKDFHKSQIDRFISGKGPPATGHFTQEIWAETWRVGCGYTVYKTGSQYKELYTCNYGPGGNMKTESIYKKGNPCSACPSNSCCGSSCPSPNYPGLCQITGDKGPQYEKPSGTFFYCSFSNEPDCAMKVTQGANKWQISNTLSGSYVGIVLNGGESSTLSFTVPFKGQKSLCFISYYRRGPQVAGQDIAGDAKEVFSIVGRGSVFEPKLSPSNKFMQFGITLGWKMATTVAISFSVPSGSPAQYLEVKDMQVIEGPCPPS